MIVNLSIVIVNWNSGPQLRECLASIGLAIKHLPPTRCSVDVVVVDNGSSDGSEQNLSVDNCTLRLIQNGMNRGFAAACNQGAKASNGDLLLFLNPDTRLFEESLKLPLLYMTDTANAQVGILGIQMVDERGEIARSCARFPGPKHFLAQALGLDRLIPRTAHAMREWDHAETREVDQVIGAFFLIRSSVFELLHGFDERFFVYFEEVDLALRARQAGWSCVYLAEARAFHKGGGTSDQVKALRLFYSLRSRLLYGQKHFDHLQRIMLIVATWLMEPVSRCLNLALRGRWREIGNVARAYQLLATNWSPTKK